MEADVPRLSAVICTRNRGSSIVPTLESILANKHPAFEVIVVDQSADDRSAIACVAYSHDRRLRYLRSQTTGSGRGRNVGLLAAAGEIVVYTDDDCVVPNDWLDKFEQAFRVDPNIAVVFCQVTAASHDHAAGFIPDYLIAESKLTTSLRQKTCARGIGAGMAVRRDPFTRMGGFDESLGPGAIFPACEDGDVAVRALIRGNYVLETNTTSVIHYGFRTWREGRSLARRNWVGIGAAYAKPLKLSYWGILRVIAYEGLWIALGGALRPMLKLQRPRGLRNFIFFLSGFWQGLWAPVDRNTLKFVRREEHA